MIKCTGVTYLLGVLAIATLGAAAAPKKFAWQQFTGDPQATRRSPLPGPKSTSSTGAVWEVSIGESDNNLFSGVPGFAVDGHGHIILPHVTSTGSGAGVMIRTVSDGSLISKSSRTEETSDVSQLFRVWLVNSTVTTISFYFTGIVAGSESGMLLSYVECDLRTQECTSDRTYALYEDGVSGYGGTLTNSTGGLMVVSQYGDRAFVTKKGTKWVNSESYQSGYQATAYRPNEDKIFTVTAADWGFISLESGNYSQLGVSYQNSVVYLEDVGVYVVGGNNLLVIDPITHKTKYTYSSACMAAPILYQIQEPRRLGVLCPEVNGTAISAFDIYNDSKPQHIWTTIITTPVTTCACSAITFSSTECNAVVADENGVTYTNYERGIVGLSPENGSVLLNLTGNYGAPTAIGLGNTLILQRLGGMPDIPSDDDYSKTDDQASATDDTAAKASTCVALAVSTFVPFEKTFTIQLIAAWTLNTILGIGALCFARCTRQ